jgi:acetoin utilization deacetylase AcuC-like enzyme
MPVSVIWHPSTLEHHAGPEHPERPERLHAVLAELRSPAFADGVVWREAEAAETAELVRVHPPGYLEMLAGLANRGGGPLDEDTVMNAASYDAALHAAGAAIEVARRALSGEAAFAPVRPPGHHALAERAMGFCLINNVVVAARAALEDLGAGAILIIDCDVHHGNGTQALVEADRRIRYVSLHQWPLYPGTGQAHERGVGNVFNVPLPPGLPRKEYVRSLDNAVERAVDGWSPDLILVSAGFDAMAGDPLAGFTLEPEDYGVWTRNWLTLGAPIGAVLEGGYTPDRIRLAAGELVRALA